MSPRSFNHYFLLVRWQGGSGDRAADFSTKSHSRKPFSWITHSRLVVGLFFFFAQMNWTNRRTLSAFCDVTQTGKWDVYFLFIYITFCVKRLPMDIGICLWWTGKKLVLCWLSEIQSDFRISHIWKLLIFLENHGHSLERKVNGSFSKISEGMRQDVWGSIWEECKEQQLCQGYYNKTTSYSDSCLSWKKIIMQYLHNINIKIIKNK